MKTEKSKAEVTGTQIVVMDRGFVYVGQMRFQTASGLSGTFATHTAQSALEWQSDFAITPLVRDEATTEKYYPEFVSPHGAPTSRVMC